MVHKTSVYFYDCCNENRALDKRDMADYIAQNRGYLMSFYDKELLCLMRII